MNRTLVFLLLLALLALGVTLLLPKPYEAGQVSPGDRRDNEPPAAVTENLPASRAEAAPHREAGGRTAIAPRGVHGRVLDERALPVRGARVSLIPHTGEGRAEAMTDEDGLFRVRSEVAGDEVWFEVRVRAEGLIERGIGGLSLRPGIWRDIGTFRLERGGIVEGNVVGALSGRPIPDAEVWIVGPDAPGSAVHGGIAAGTRTDSAGRYRINGAPFSALTIAAVAKGHAQAAREGVRLHRDADNQCDFALRPGFEVPGSVVDRDGRPIPGASIHAQGIESRSRTGIQARSDGEGRFVLRGLGENGYHVSVSHEAYAPREVGPIGVGTRELPIVLARLGCVEVLAMDSSGEMLTEYLVTLRRLVAGQEAYGRMQVPKVRVRVEPGEFGTIPRLPKVATPYVLQIEAEGNAHGFSEPFEVDLDRPPVRVFVQLNQGGSLVGFVHAGGAPLAGASVATRADEMVNRPEEMHRLGEAPTNLTTAQTRTGADGRFELRRLFPGRYFLFAAHAEYCDQVAGPFEVRLGDMMQVPAVELRSGFLLSGVVRLDGALAPGMKVVIAPTSGPRWRRAGVEAITRADGSFSIHKRMPAGAYQVVAGRRARPEPGSALAEGPRTVQEIQVAEGVRTTSVELEIKGR
jgi:hypothetical protein